MVSFIIWKSVLWAYCKYWPRRQFYAGFAVLLSYRPRRRFLFCSPVLERLEPRRSCVLIGLANNSPALERLEPRRSCVLIDLGVDLFCSPVLERLEPRRSCVLIGFGVVFCLFCSPALERLEPWRSCVLFDILLCIWTAASIPASGIKSGFRQPSLHTDHEVVPCN